MAIAPDPEKAAVSWLVSFRDIIQSKTVVAMRDGATGRWTLMGRSDSYANMADFLDAYPEARMRQELGYFTGDGIWHPRFWRKVSR